MRRHHCLVLLLSLCVVLGASHRARADSKRFGEYEVDYGVVASNFLRPEVAAGYGITRARNRAVVNVTLHRRIGEQWLPVAARVTGEHGDLIRKSPIAFREMRRDGAVFAVGEFAFEDGDSVYFRLAIVPEGDNATLVLEFNQTLYAD
jgi:Domain of unknown function (DUF4426)